jgi:hypothetical protein
MMPRNVWRFTRRKENGHITAPGVQIEMHVA